MTEPGLMGVAKVVRTIFCLRVMEQARLRQSPRGFVLLEVLVGLSILSVGVVTAMSGLRMSIRGLSVSEQNQSALLLLEDRLEHYSRLVPSRSEDSMESSSESKGQYQCEVRVESWDPEKVAAARGDVMPESTVKAGGATGTQLVDVASDLKQLRVVVRWRDGSAHRSVDGVRLIWLPAGRIIWEDVP